MRSLPQVDTCLAFSGSAHSSQAIDLGEIPGNDQDAFWDFSFSVIPRESPVTPALPFNQPRRDLRVEIGGQIVSVRGRIFPCQAC